MNRAAQALNIQRALYLAMRAAPYAATALATARLVPPWACPPAMPPTTACDAGWRVYISAAAAAWSAPELAWALLHEVLGHLVRDHHTQTRAQGIDPARANRAQDREINGWAWAGLTPPVTPLRAADLGLPDGLLWPAYLEDEAPATGGGCGQGACTPDTQGWQSLPPDDARAPAVSAPLAAAVRQATAEAIRRAAPSSVPAGLVVWADALLTPPPRAWRQVLRAVMARALTPAPRDLIGRPHERRGIYTPRWASQRPHVVVLADTSGSMNNAGGAVLGCILHAARAARVDVVWCDTAARTQRDVRTRSALRPVGGGGTDWRDALACAPASDLLLIVTDGACPWPDRPPRRPCAVLLTEPASVPPAWRRLAVLAGVTP